MSTKLRPYPEYRDSGVDWLGRVPAHWEVVRNGRLFAARNETGFPDLPILEVSLRTGVRVRDMEGGRKQQMADRSKYKRAAHGDIAYNIMRMWQGAVGVAPCDGLISPAREIELIVEYRDSMVAAIVTGQLDVREAEIAVVERTELVADLPSDDEDMEDALEPID
jgi:hypothetical protein